MPQVEVREVRPTGAWTCSWTGSRSRATSGRSGSRSRCSTRSGPRTARSSRAAFRSSRGRASASTIRTTSGFWFNYGDVNGVDFWNNSDALTPAEQAKMGRIVHTPRRRGRAAGADGRARGRGRLGDARRHGRPRRAHPLRRSAPSATARGIERVTTLTARARPVTFTDNKEGVLGLRVARALEQPADEAGGRSPTRTGKPTTVPVLDNTGVTGLYTSSEGLKGDAVWGTRGRWMALAGKVADEDVVLLMLDHPKNPGYPTYWHARGYGLFAANPLGRGRLQNGKESAGLHARPGTARFRHRLLVLPGPFSREPRREAARVREVARARGPLGRLRRLRQHHRHARPARRARRASGSPPSSAGIGRRPRPWPPASGGAPSPATRTSSPTARWTSS